jgi:hypothetical protein
MKSMTIDGIVIFVLYVLGDLLTTSIFLQTGGHEVNPVFVVLFMMGVEGVIQVVVIKLIVFTAVILMMYTLLQVDLLKLYKFFVYTIEGLSIFVIISNLLVILINKNVIQLLGIQ